MDSVNTTNRDRIRILLIKQEALSNFIMDSIEDVREKEITGILERLRDKCNLLLQETREMSYQITIEELQEENAALRKQIAESKLREQPADIDNLITADEVSKDEVEETFVPEDTDSLRPAADEVEAEGENVPDATYTQGEYESVKTIAEETNEKLEENSSEVYRNDIHKKASEWKAGGKTLRKIAELFNKDNLPTFSGTGKWTEAKVHSLLSRRREWSNPKH